ncbi:MAG: hypothetical protein CMH54_11390 [Myxococcales bacterium]|nr:hypothetical protein [Myxococcales bacterium]
MTETSWTIRTNGVDYGPYSSEEILQLIASGDLRKDDPVTAQPLNNPMLVGDDEVFLQACLVAEKERKQRFIEEEAESNIRHMRHTQRRRPIMVGLLLLVIGGVGYGVVVMRTSERSMAQSTHLSALTPISAAGEMGSFQAFVVAEPEVPPEKEPEAPAVTAAKKKPVRSARRVVKKAKPKKEDKKPDDQPMRFDYTADAINVDDAEEDEEPGRLFPLSTGEFRAFREIVRGRVKHCQRTQSDRLPSGNYKILLTLTTSGRVKGARISPPTDGSEQLIDCLNQYTAFEKTREFSGQSMTLSYPFVWGGTD